MAAELVLFVAAMMLVWSYLLYPALVFTLAATRKKNRAIRHNTTAGITDREQYNAPAIHPVSVLIPVYNEEKVISEKLTSLMLSDYPDEFLEIIVGSDASDDSTDDIVRSFDAGGKRIRLHRSDTRRGKAAMLNDLAAIAGGDILIITDANVIFSSDTVRLLAEGISAPGIGLCDASVTPEASSAHGVAPQENFYSRYESALKNAESVVWGTMTGPYGGCYAIRHDLFPFIPDNTLVDDLFVGLTVVRKNYAVVNIPSASVTEDTQSDLAGQYKRRVRIAAGSYQNLFRFGPFPSPSIKISFSFFSHKVLRWFSPFLLLLVFMTTVILSASSVFYFCLLALQLIFILLSALDLALNLQGRSMLYLRYVTQFLMMNAALTEGFLKVLTGIKNGIWEPTKRD
ncbi:MAG: glycosyltransferase [Bacteroidales bacterium]|jgi:cellulose synthase/poly-beta-1,6-N-acetylglucosamine synthase-like glycosyltransferase|nr:glycosyltransferase [Bacteroidales bacterium]